MNTPRNPDPTANSENPPSIVGAFIASAGVWGCILVIGYTLFRFIDWLTAPGAALH